jgi:3D (Asp-Asp-Asp) domain-containing protein
MNKHALRRAAAACFTTVLTVSAGAVNSADIKKDLDKALQQRNAAHQLAENARALGAEEHHYTIWYAKQMWNEHNETVIDLTKQYNAAVAEEKKKAEENSKGQLLGTFKCTYYTGAADEGGNITALGTPVTPWYTVAVDPRVIPLGSKIRIEGYDGIFYCADTGSAIKGSILDIAVGSKSEASNLGVQYHKVYLVK